jgi:hypothetical protein
LPPKFVKVTKSPAIGDSKTGGLEIPVHRELAGGPFSSRCRPLETGLGCPAAVHEAIGIRS